MRLPKKYKLLSNLESNLLKLRKDANAKRPNVRRNIASVITLDKSVGSFANVKVVKTVEKKPNFLICLFISTFLSD